MSERTYDADVSKISSAQILTFFTPDRELVQNIRNFYVQDNPATTNHPSWFSDDEIFSLYTGKLESLHCLDRIKENDPNFYEFLIGLRLVDL